MVGRWLADPRWRWGGAALLAALAAMALYAVRAVLPPFLLAFVLAYALHPPVDQLHRMGLRRAWAILLVYALVGLLAGAVIVFVVPLFVNELSGLAETIPRYVSEVQRFLAGLERRFDRIPLPGAFRTLVDEHVARAQAVLLGGISRMVGAVFDLLGQAFTIVLAPVLAFYMLNDLPHFRRQLEASLPPVWRQRVKSFLGELDRVLAGFIRGQLIVSAAVGAMTAAAMGILGLPFALVLGIIAFFTDLVPYFGPFLGAVPGVLLAATTSWTLALKAAAAYLIIQQVEAAVLIPRVMGNSVGVHPLLLVFALLVGGRFFGLAGLLLAVPAAGCLKVAATFLVRWLTAPRQA